MSAADVLRKVWPLCVCRTKGPVVTMKTGLSGENRVVCQKCLYLREQPKESNPEATYERLRAEVLRLQDVARRVEIASTLASESAPPCGRLGFVGNVKNAAEAQKLWETASSRLAEVKIRVDFVLDRVTDCASMALQEAAVTVAGIDEQGAGMVQIELISLGFRVKREAEWGKDQQFPMVVRWGI